MSFGRRRLSRTLLVPFQWRHYSAALNILLLCARPWDMLLRYGLRRGSYPATIRVRTPTGTVALTLHSWHDARTVVEIFCAKDYAAQASDRVVVDYGSNIGISAAYFLSRGGDVRVHLFEPLPRNLERLKANLAGYEGRYDLQAIAVGLADGEVTFGWEETGRYGGIGRATGNYIQVACRDSAAVLAEIIARHGRIDILKIDVETLERELTENIPPALRPSIAKIYVEYPFTENPLAETHTIGRHGSISRFLGRKLARDRS